MTIFSHFFGNAQARQLKQRYAQIEERVKREYAPIGKIGVAIIEGAGRCRDEAKQFIKAEDEKDRQTREIFSFYEFLYFFMHMSNRQAFASLTEAHIAKLHEYLGPFISSVAIDAYFAHWPADLKHKMTGEFYEKLNEAELEYSAVTQRTSSEEGSPELHVLWAKLFRKLGSNVADLVADNRENEEVVGSVSASALSELEKMQLERLMGDVKLAEGGQ